MAFESLYEYPEQLKLRFMSHERIKQKAVKQGDRQTFLWHCAYQSQILEDMVTYKNTTLKPSRFKYQRSACEKIIKELQKIRSK